MKHSERWNIQVLVNTEDSTCSSTLQSDGFEEESDDDEVGKESGEPDDLARGVESLHDDEVDCQPSQDQGPQQLPLNSPGMLDAGSDAENTTTEIFLHFYIDCNQQTVVVTFWDIWSILLMARKSQKDNFLKFSQFSQIC